MTWIGKDLLLYAPLDVGAKGIEKIVTLVEIRNRTFWRKGIEANEWTHFLFCSDECIVTSDENYSHLILCVLFNMV